MPSTTSVPVTRYIRPTSKCYENLRWKWSDSSVGRLAVRSHQSFVEVQPGEEPVRRLAADRYLGEASVGSKQWRQRASYMPVAPIKTRSLLTTSRCVWFAGSPHTTQIASVFVMYSAIASSCGIGSNGRPR